MPRTLLLVLLTWVCSAGASAYTSFHPCQDIAKAVAEDEMKEKYRVSYFAGVSVYTYFDSMNDSSITWVVYFTANEDQYEGRYKITLDKKSCDPTAVVPVR